MFQLYNFFRCDTELSATNCEYFCTCEVNGEFIGPSKWNNCTSSVTLDPTTTTTTTTTTSVTTTTFKTEGGSNNEAVYIAIGILIPVLLIFLIVLVCYFWRKRKDGTNVFGCLPKTLSRPGLGYLT